MADTSKSAPAPKRERTPPPEYASDLLGSALLTSMGKPSEFTKRLREFVAMHLAVNGHAIVIPPDQYMSRRFRGYNVNVALRDDGAVELFAVDPQGNRVQPSEAAPQLRPDAANHGG